MQAYVGQFFSYNHPHVQSWLFDTKVAYPELAPLNSMITLSPIAGADGRDNTPIEVDSLKGLNDKFGKYSARLGYPFLALYDHIASNGRAKVVNLKPENATYAHKVISMKLKKSSVKYKISDDGILWAVAPENEGNTALKDITIPVYEFSVEFDSFGSSSTFPAKSKGALELGASTLLDLKLDNDGEGVTLLKAPVYIAHSTGRGLYGNKYGLSFKPARGDVRGFPLYAATVTKNKETIVEPATIVAPDDVRDSLPFSFNEVMRNEYVDIVTLEDNHVLVNDMIITAINDVIANLEGQKATIPAAGRLAERLEVIKQKHIVEANDLFFHTADWLAVCSTDETRRIFSAYRTDGYETRQKAGLWNEFDFIFPIQRIAESFLSFNLDGGHDGDLALASRFNWAYTIYRDANGDGKVDLSALPSNPDKIRVYENLYKDFFSGIITEDIYDPQLCDADIVEDLDYPLSIKQLVIGFVDALRPVGSRGDLTYLYNSPLATATVSDIKNENLVVNPQVNEVFRFCQSVEIINPFTDKKEKVPSTYVVRRLVNNWFKNGWGMTNIAGNTVEGIADTASIVPKLRDGSPKSDVSGMGYNYISIDHMGMPYLDGQRSSYTKMYSALSELHNKLIHNRMMKMVIGKLQKDIHKIDTPEECQKVASSLREMLDQQFKSKLVIKDVVLAPRNKREAAIGDLTLQIFLEYAGTIKRIQVNFFTGPLGTF